jgi:hypothetical protein
MELEDAFKLEKRGKNDYFKKKKNQDLGDQLYGWMAFQIQPSIHTADLLDHGISFSK